MCLRSAFRPRQRSASGGKARSRWPRISSLFLCDIAETRVALIENGIIAELQIERHGAQPKGGSVGDIYLGKVTRVLPGLQAAFIDIGLDRAAFLHVEDLIRPADFEAYLAGGRKHALGTGTSENGQEVPGEGEVADGEADDAPAAAAEDDAPSLLSEAQDEEPAAAPGDDEATDVGHPPPLSEPSFDADAAEAADDSGDDALDEASEASTAEDDDDDVPDTSTADLSEAHGVDTDPPTDQTPPAAARADRDSDPGKPAPIDDLLDDPNLPGFTG